MLAVALATTSQRVPTYELDWPSKAARGEIVVLALVG
jgi:hypothetical protein